MAIRETPWQSRPWSDNLRSPGGIGYAVAQFVPADRLRGDRLFGEVGGELVGLRPRTRWG